MKSVGRITSKSWIPPYILYENKEINLNAVDFESVSQNNFLVDLESVKILIKMGGKELWKKSLQFCFRST